MNNLFILHVVHFRFIGADIDVLNTGVAAIKIIKSKNWVGYRREIFQILQILQKSNWLLLSRLSPRNLSNLTKIKLIIILIDLNNFVRFRGAERRPKNQWRWRPNNFLELLEELSRVAWVSPVSCSSNSVKFLEYLKCNTRVTPPRYSSITKTPRYSHMGARTIKILWIASYTTFLGAKVHIFCKPPNIFWN